MMLIHFRGRLNPIDPTKFEAKCPWQNPYSHGYRYQTQTPSTRDLSRLWVNGPANYYYGKDSYRQSPIIKMLMICLQ